MQKGTFTNVDNDTRRVDYIKLGAVDGIDSGTRGTYYFDAFVSRRQTYIGMRRPGGAELGMVSPGVGSIQTPVSLQAAPKSFAALAPIQQSEQTTEGALEMNEVKALANPLSANLSMDGILVTTTVVISYTYDPLNRLTLATYDDGMFFRYTYDAVGNQRYKQTKDSTNEPTVVYYYYDAANRLIRVDSVDYLWDDNGNLLSDGVNTYSYDHANRLVGVSGAGQNVNYSYNGLGDRLRETANGVPKHYTMDLNAGLTQVLQDGTNTYLYGNGRIAQYGANGAEYFLGDALGSVRQVVDADGNLTLGRKYKPYGEVLVAAGDGATSYGFTNEWTDGSTMAVYLRARWYAPGQGRFLTKDVWEGDYTRSLSLNRWIYVEANPINYQDPTGNDRYGPARRTPCTVGFGGGWFPWDIKLRVDEAERYAPRTSNEIDTYVAAGIAIQCAGIDAISNASSSVGIAQISYPEAETELKEDEEGNVISFGLRKRCENGELEKVLDPMKPKDAVELMKRRILLTIEHCVNCTDTDKYIAAALAQNGSGFRYDRMRDEVHSIKLNRIKFYKRPDLVSKDWLLFFQEDAKDHDVINTTTQLIRFDWIIIELRSRGWFVPPFLDTADIEKLKKSNFEVSK